MPQINGDSALKKLSPSGLKRYMDRETPVWNALIKQRGEVPSAMKPFPPKARK